MINIVCRLCAVNDLPLFNGVKNVSEFSGVLFADAGDVEDFPAGGVDDAKLSAEVCKSAVGGGFSRFRQGNFGTAREKGVFFGKNGILFDLFNRRQKRRRVNRLHIGKINDKLLIFVVEIAV